MGGVLVIGSISIDNVVQLKEIPEKDGIAAGKGFTHLGGRGANQAAAASRMGAGTALIACCGTDFRAETALDALTRDNVDISRVFRERAVPTGMAQISVDRYGNRAISLAPEANQYLSSERIRQCEDSIAHASIVLVQCEIPEETVHEVIHLAAKHKIPLMLNNAPVRHFSPDVLSMAAYLVVNETGLNRMAGKTAHHVESLEITAGELTDKTVIIIQSHRQVLLVEKGTSRQFKAPIVAAVDKTGSSGVFCGVLAALLMEGARLDDAVKTAVSAMALSTTRFGAQPSAPYPLEIDAFLQRAEHEADLRGTKHIGRLQEKARKMRVAVIRMLDAAR